VQIVVRPLDHANPDLHLSAARRSARHYQLVKRSLDILVAAAGLILLLPLLLALAIAIKFDSPGPALYRQTRVGMNSKAFRILKFRSMHRDAESRIEALRHLNEADGPVFKIRKDPRTTRIGRFLRRTSLDELPQLLNVLSGEMTLVGPRPPLPGEVAQYRPQDRLRLSVKPGITCLWQIRGRSECTFEEWMEYDREYIDNRSTWLDVRIMARTMMAVLTSRGAY
jgi:exopolysaccharide biosynthesis polyprenyl glycosylphosphotransferase